MKKKTKENINLPSNLKFGYFFTFIFLIGSIYFYFKEIIFLFYSLGIISLIFLVITSIKADILEPLNKLWMNFGLILGSIVNPLTMGFIFFFIFTPIGIIMRIFGRDDLLIRLKNKSSYWIKRNKDLQQVNFKKQF